MEHHLLTFFSKIIGVSASGLLFGSFSVYTIFYVLLLGKFKMPKWKDITFLANEIKTQWFRLFTACQILAFIASLAFLMLTCVIFSATPQPRIIFSTISLVFSIMFVLLSSEHYFIQLTYVRTCLRDHELTGLENFTQLYSKSMIISKNILGWTLFFGLSTLFLIPLFDHSALGLCIKICLAVNSFCCFSGVIGYSFNNMFLNILFFNGMGLSVIALGLLNMFYFSSY